MKSYLAWSLRQFYLLACWPTRFKREVEGEEWDSPQLSWGARALYVAKLTPWFALFGIVANLVVGSLFEVFNLPYDWPFSWFGVAFGVAGGVAFLISFWLTYFRLATFPLDVLLSWLALRLGRWFPQSLSRAWRLCPVAWNEVIWLPLPFVDTLLTLLARQDRSKGLEQIAFVVAERPLQRRAAIAALCEIVLEDLKAASLDTLTGLTDRLNWIGTSEMPTSLPPVFDAALPRFDRVAQHVGQSLSVRSNHRKAHSLNQAGNELEALQTSLAIAQGRYAPRLLKIANEWNELLDAERERLRLHVHEAQEIPNPFAFGNPVAEREDNLFVGRRDIAQRIEADILGASDTPTLLLHGPRRMGKTSLLQQLPRLLGPDFAPATIDCQNPAVVTSEARLLGYLARGMTQGLNRHRIPVTKLTPNALSREPFATFSDWLDDVEDKMPEGMRLLLCLDEYERLQEPLDAGWGGKFLDTLRHTIQHRPKIALMFTGSHTFAELGPAWTDRFISGRQIRVGRLTRDDVIPLLTEPIPDFGMTYADGALDALIDATNGQPFLTQAVAFELVQTLNEGKRTEATPNDIETAITRAIVSGDAYFSNVWNDAGDGGRAILTATLRGETPPDHPTAARWLQNHDVLDTAGGFVVPIFQRWLEAQSH